MEDVLSVSFSHQTHLPEGLPFCPSGYEVLKGRLCPEGGGGIGERFQAPQGDGIREVKDLDLARCRDAQRLSGPA
jgi:hypothetical protein